MMPRAKTFSSDERSERVREAQTIKGRILTQYSSLSKKKKLIQSNGIKTKMIKMNCLQNALG